MESRARRRPRGMAFLLALTTSFLACSWGLASSVPLALDQLTRLSGFVVHGRVAEVASGWNEERTTIHTLIRLEVLEILKGTGAGDLIIEVEGGRVGEVATHISGSPQFRRGEEVLVFLMRDPRGRYRLVGLEQGKYRIERDGGAKARVYGSYPTARLLPYEADRSAADGSLPLAMVMAELRALGQAQGGGQWLR